jgi:uncharacterized protein with GYD domain
MSKYLLEVKYLSDGVKGVMKDGGSKRRAAAEKAVKSVGGTLEAFYFAFGAADAYVISDIPDNATAASLAMTLNASGMLTTRTVVLLSPEEIDTACGLSPKYKPPGK